MPPTSQSPKVLSLPSWYPETDDPTHGIFSHKHILAAAQDCEMTVLYISSIQNKDGTPYDIYISEENGINVIRLHYNVPASTNALDKFRRYFLATRKGIRTVIDEFGKPDLCHVHVAHPAGRVALYLKVLHDIPYVLSEHWTGYTDNNNLYDLMPSLNRSLVKKIFKNSSEITAVSNYLLKAIETCGLSDGKGVVIPNIIEAPKDYQPKKAEAKPYILTISDLRDDQKNISGLLNAFLKFREEYPNAELHHIGLGEDEKMLKELANSLGLADNVTFHSYIPNEQLSKYFDKADFFVLNSNYETFSVVTAESFLHGVPVVITKCGAPEDYVDDSNGILVERNDIGSLCFGMVEMMQKLDQFDLDGIRKNIISLYSQEEIRQKFKDLYQSVLVHE